jgi:hydrogenase maturation protein HypF
MAGAAGPIVLVRPNPDQPLAPQIAPDQSHLGIMFPTTPLHHLLLAACDHPIVCTSGNTSHLPPSTHNDQARTQLSKIADAFLFHDREIARRLDDSVVRIIANEPRVFRAGRGFAPISLPLPPGTKDTPALLATGAQQKATFCFASKDQLVLSPYIGTLDSLDMLQDWQQTLHELLSVYHITPTHVAVDAHPAYEASQFGRHMAEQARLPLFSIQHHHAHIASCLVEHSYPLDGPPVLGVVLDGLGASEQGELWGGEFIKADYQTYTRLGHCKPVAMIGGDQAAHEPWRNAYAHIMAAMGWQTFQTRYNTLPLYEQLSRQPRAILDQSLMTGRRTPLASSCGRLFDAVAAACGLFPERTSYEGQAAIALEALAFRHPQAHNPPNEGYPIRPAQDPTSGLPFLDPTPMWRALLDDMLAGETPATIAMKFHLGLAHGIVMMVRHCQDAFAERPVIVLSGGVWQNALLLEYALPLLRRDGHVVFTHRTIPANDGGLAVGQAMIAIARLQAKGEI